MLQLGPPAAGGRTSEPLLQFSNILSEYSRTALPQQRDVSLALAGGRVARVRLLLPPGYHPEDRIAFPTLFSL